MQVVAGEGVFQYVSRGHVLGAKRAQLHLATMGVQKRNRLRNTGARTAYQTRLRAQAARRRRSDALPLSKELLLRRALHPTLAHKLKARALIKNEGAAATAEKQVLAGDLN